jgi:hypothetical protein
VILVVLISEVEMIFKPMLSPKHRSLMNDMDANTDHDIVDAKIDFIVYDNACVDFEAKDDADHMVTDPDTNDIAIDNTCTSADADDNSNQLTLV